MSKIDQITQKLKNRMFDVEDSWHTERLLSLDTVEELLEQLRPYVELAELVVKNASPAYNSKKETILLNKRAMDKLYKLIQQIKEEK